MGRVAFAFMAAALFFLGSMQPVFASESDLTSPDNYTPAYSSGTDTVSFSWVSTVPKSITPVYFHTAFDSAVGDSSAGVVDSVTYFCSVKVQYQFTGYRDGVEYSGRFSAPLMILVPSVGSYLSNYGYSIVGIALDSYSLPDGVSLRDTSSGTSQQLNFEFDFSDYVFLTNFNPGGNAPRQYGSFYLYYYVTVASNDSSLMRPAYYFHGTDNVNTAKYLQFLHTGSTSTNSFSLTYFNYNDFDYANNIDMSFYRLYYNTDVANNLLRSLHSDITAFDLRQVQQFANLQTKLDLIHSEQMANDNANTLTLHNDLLTLHHDLTDPDASQDDAKDAFESIEAEKESVESEFKSSWNPDSIADDYEVLLDDNPMFSGSLLEGASFWLDMSNEFFNSARNENADYPFLIQIFFNLFGQLW